MKKLLILLSIFSVFLILNTQTTKAADGRKQSLINGFDEYQNELERWSIDLKQKLLIADLNSNEYKELTSRISRDQALTFNIVNLLRNKLHNDILPIVLGYFWPDKQRIKLHTKLFNEAWKAKIDSYKKIAGKIGFD